MKDPRSFMEYSEGSILHEKNLVEEMRELRKLRTAVMMEKCLSRNDVVMCPKPRRRHTRLYEEQIDIKVGDELSDIMLSKASPPYYSGSPPIRSSNPLIQDARFREQRFSQITVGGGVHIEGLDATVGHSRKTRSVLTMA